MSGTFEVSKEGLAKLLEKRGKKFVPLELIQNALDEDGVRSIAVSVEPSQTRGYCRIRVEDDAPEGFHDLSHAWTLFAESRKKKNPEQRGKWNLGDKLVIAVCRWAQITTTTGRVTFADNERKRGRTKTEAGSVFEGECRMTLTEAAEAIDVVKTVLVPEGVTLTINGEAVDCRRRAASMELKLTTEIADSEGFLRSTKRNTTLSAFNPREGEEPHLYEMGIPVVPVDCDWHIDIGQKIPLNFDRDNVTPAYLRTVLTAVVNLLHEEIRDDQEQAAKPWVGEALSSKDIEPEAVRSIITARHGKDRVAYDPSDVEGTSIATMRGFQVVHGGSYSSEQWANIKEAGAIKPAGQVTPSPKPFHTDGKTLKTVDPKDYTPAHQRLVDYAQSVGFCLTGKDLRVVLAVDGGWGFGGAFGSNTLTINLWNRSWLKDSSWEAGTRCELPTTWGLDKLLIHEFAHHKVSNHLSESFHEECCKLGAKLAMAIRHGNI